MQDRGREAITVLREAVDALTGSSDAHSRAQALSSLGDALLNEDGHGDGAITAFTDAAAHYLEAGDERRRGMAERCRGQALLTSGRLDEAADAFREAVSIAQAAGDRREECLALSLLGTVLPDAQQDDAVVALEKAVTLLRDAGEPELERLAMSRLLSIKLPAPSAAELRARIEAGLVEAIMPRPLGSRHRARWTERR